MNPLSRCHGLTPLYAASIRGHLDVVKYLLNANSTPMIMPEDRLSCFHDGLQKWIHVEIVKLLYKYYPNILNLFN